MSLKSTRMQNHEYKRFTRKDLWACAGLRIYAIMLPSSVFSDAHCELTVLNFPKLQKFFNVL